MCGRYALTADVDELVEAFGVPEPEFDWAPRYNIAPTQSVPVVAEDRHGRRMGLMRWGLVPFWADDPAIGNRLINARSETVGTKPAFREAFARRRCLVPASGFYEWGSTDGTKRPYWVHSPDESLLAFAAVWDRWRPEEGDPIYSFAILTTDASHEVRAVHDRMPVVIARRDRARWLERETDPAALAPLVRAMPGLVLREVSTWVNTPDHDDPECLEPVA